MADKKNKTDGKPPEKPARKSAKIADLEKLAQKVLEKNVIIADIGKIADQVVELITPLENTANLPGDNKIADEALVKIEAILALVRGEDLGEWARARIGL